MSITSIIGTINDGAKVVTSFVRLSDDIQDLFGGSDGGGTYSANLEEVKKQIQTDKITIEKLQYADVFLAKINRIAPFYDSESASIINSMLQSISIVHDGLETQEDKVGGGYFNWHVGIQAGEIQATFSEFEQCDVVDFLTKMSTGSLSNSSNGVFDGVSSAINSINGAVNTANSIITQAGNISSALGGDSFSGAINLGVAGDAMNMVGSLIGGTTGGVGSGKGGRIMPSDGTLLLPYEYFFEISIIHLIIDPISGTVTEKVVIQDDYILDGSPSQEYSVGDERYLEITATFVPIKS